MLEKHICEEILGVALSRGGDFAELFFEETARNSLHWVDGSIDTASNTILSGVGIRVFDGVQTVYAYTVDITREGLLKCAVNVAEMVGQLEGKRSVILAPMSDKSTAMVKNNPTETEGKARCELLIRGCLTAKNADEKILQVNGMLLGVDRSIVVANSEGLFVSDRHVRSRMAISCVAGKDNDTQSGSDSPGAGMGLEYFDIKTPESIGKEAARQALVNLSADYCKAGKMTVAIENGFGGVIFHEACGHSLEATSVGTGTSQMCGKMGQKIANEKVTAIDDGTIEGGWGSMHIDDEGTPSQKNILIEKGILKTYMVDRLGSRRMNMPMTGSSRRQNYTFEPTSRMTNTYIDNGPDKNEDIIASIEHGLYCRKMGGGSVNPLTGAFNFAVTEGYLVENGKITNPVRGASLIGTGSEILTNIDMVGQNLERAQGMCGSSSGSIPTDVGQPLIRVSEITVGGR